MKNRAKLLKACACALTQNLGLESGEHVLIVTDGVKGTIGELFREAASGLAERVDLLAIPVPSRNGEEPPAHVAERMSNVDVVLIPTSKSLSWTEARLRATAKGVRIASMPGITEEIILRTFMADYESIRNRVNHLCDLMDETAVIRVVTDLGTDLTMNVTDRRGRGRNGGIYSEASAWGNLPCGEAFIAPLEGSCEGEYVVDAAQSGVGELRSPISVLVNCGKAVDFRGGAEAAELAQLIRSVGNEEAYNIAELGIGCNETASSKSITLEAEKALGTCHIAIGSNHLFGGTVEVNVHLDGVIRSPTIYFDGEVILEKGKFSVA